MKLPLVVVKLPPVEVKLPLTDVICPAVDDILFVAVIVSLETNKLASTSFVIKRCEAVIGCVPLSLSLNSIVSVALINKEDVSASVKVILLNVGLSLVPKPKLVLAVFPLSAINVLPLPTKKTPSPTLFLLPPE